MKHFLTLILTAVLSSGIVRAADAPDPVALLDKAIKAAGGETRLAQAKAMIWKTKGTVQFDGNESRFTASSKVADLDHARLEFEGDFGGNLIQAFTVIDGSKGSREFAGNALEIDPDGLAHEKRNLYLQVLPVLLTPLKGKDYKLESAEAAPVDSKPAPAVKVTPPDGKPFTLYFSSETGLPVKLDAKVIDFTGTEFRQEVFYSGYKEMDGIQKATKMRVLRDSEHFIDVEIVEFKLPEKVDIRQPTE